MGIRANDFMKCKEKGCNGVHFAKGYCKPHYGKKNYVNIPVFGTKGKHYLYTNGVTEELKPLISTIKNKVLDDCIKNPGKYLKY